jgi:hypothetical protein
MPSVEEKICRTYCEIPGSQVVGRKRIIQIPPILGIGGVRCSGIVCCPKVRASMEDHTIEIIDRRAGDDG